MKFDEWNGFVEGTWSKEIDVRDFIQKNFLTWKRSFRHDLKYLGFEKKKTDKIFFYIFYLFLIKEIYSLFFTAVNAILQSKQKNT